MKAKTQFRSVIWKLALAAIVSGCATAEQSARPPRSADPRPETHLSTCADSLAAIERTIAHNDTHDAEAARVPGFSYLRINRFLAAIGRRHDVRQVESPAFAAWVKRLRSLHDNARAIELTNLPAKPRRQVEQALERIWNRPANAVKIAASCSEHVASQELKNLAQRRELLDSAKVDDNYSTAKRIIGVYPLSAVAALIGWNTWKANNLSSFAWPADELAVSGTVIDYGPAGRMPPLTTDEVKRIIANSRDPLLGIPEPSPARLSRLISTFAPVWRIDVTGEYDRLGYPYWSAPSGVPDIEIDADIDVDIERPTVFVRLSHAILDGEILPQLVYTVWFRQRPADGPLDLLSGRLDALIWRVTLGTDGRPVIYDTIHACGCYHLFFPAPPARVLPQNLDLDDEGRTIPALAPGVPTGGRMVLYVQSRSHYLRGLGVTVGNRSWPDIVAYSFVDERALTSLPWRDGGRHSLYGPDALVAGTERLERWLLWPMGIDSPGAMRQWGSHATAFVGRRHFDDPELFHGLIAQ